MTNGKILCSTQALAFLWGVVDKQYLLLPVCSDRTEESEALDKRNQGIQQPGLYSYKREFSLGFLENSEIWGKAQLASIRASGGASSFLSAVPRSAQAVAAQLKVSREPSLGWLPVFLIAKQPVRLSRPRCPFLHTQGLDTSYLSLSSPGGPVGPACQRPS